MPSTGVSGGAIFGNMDIASLVADSASRHLLRPLRMDNWMMCWGHLCASCGRCFDACLHNYPASSIWNRAWRVSLASATSPTGLPVDKWPTDAHVV